MNLAGKACGVHIVYPWLRSRLAGQSGGIRSEWHDVPETGIWAMSSDSLVNFDRLGIERSAHESTGA